MSDLMFQEMLNLIDQRRRTPARHPALSSVDGDSAMLTRMIDLQRKFAGRARRSQRLVIHSYEA